MRADWIIVVATAAVLSAHGAGAQTERKARILKVPPSPTRKWRPNVDLFVGLQTLAAEPTADVFEAAAMTQPAAPPTVDPIHRAPIAGPSADPSGSDQDLRFWSQHGCPPYRNPWAGYCEEKLLREAQSHDMGSCHDDCVEEDCHACEPSRTLMQMLFGMHWYKAFWLDDPCCPAPCHCVHQPLDRRPAAEVERPVVTPEVPQPPRNVIPTVRGTRSVPARTARFPGSRRG